jgi:hypothetical protein
MLIIFILFQGLILFFSYNSVIMYFHNEINFVSHAKYTIIT